MPKSHEFSNTQDIPELIGDISSTVSLMALDGIAFDQVRDDFAFFNPDYQLASHAWKITGESEAQTKKDAIGLQKLMIEVSNKDRKYENSKIMFIELKCGGTELEDLTLVGFASVSHSPNETELLRQKLTEDTNITLEQQQSPFRL